MHDLPYRSYRVHQRACAVVVDCSSRRPRRRVPVPGPLPQTVLRDKTQGLMGHLDTRRAYSRALYDLEEENAHG